MPLPGDRPPRLRCEDCGVAVTPIGPYWLGDWPRYCPEHEAKRRIDLDLDLGPRR